MAMRWSVRVSPELYADIRFIRLAKISASHWEAIGKLVDFWSLACSFYVIGEGVPKERFKQLGCPELLDLDFAVLINDRIRAKGEHEHFKWALSCVSNGKKGGRRKEPAGKQLVAGRVPVANRYPSLEREREQELELDSNLNPSHVGNCISSGGEVAEKKKKPKKGKTTRPISEIRAFMDCWNENCGSLASVNSKTVSPTREGHINARLEQAPIERWAEVFRAIAAWPWGQGDNDRGWKATFDYAIQAGTLDKFESGAFNTRPNPRKNYGRVDARTVSQCLPESDPVFNILED